MESFATSWQHTINFISSIATFLTAIIAVVAYFAAIKKPKLAVHARDRVIVAPPAWFKVNNRYKANTPYIILDITNKGNIPVSVDHFFYLHSAICKTKGKDIACICDNKTSNLNVNESDSITGPETQILIQQLESYIKDSIIFLRLSKILPSKLLMQFFKKSFSMYIWTKDGTRFKIKLPQTML